MIRLFAALPVPDCRALECVLHQQVKAEAFWSRGDARAPIHHDDYDIIVIQLKGAKRWFIGGDPSDLPNAWKGIPDAATLRIDNEQVIEVGPGDLLYLPRGTKHRVDALADSLHISIGFVPLTAREAIMAALDHFSDLERGLRVSVGDRLSTAVARDDFTDIAAHIRRGVAALAQLCASDDFIAEALQRRSSRVISELDKLPAAGFRPPQVTGELRVRHNPLAMCHLSANAEKIDFSHPGGHIYIHRGAEAGVRFIATTPEFRVRDVPGDFGDDVRFALVGRFLDAGFLQALGD
jgi:bifunctional lysine-specific demethylase and histidyl-hydroxylase MINA